MHAYSISDAIHLEHQLPLEAADGMWFAELAALTKPWHRVRDLAIAVPLALVAAPVVGVAALFLKLTTRGTVLRRDTYLGYRARPFTGYRLRVRETLPPKPVLARREDWPPFTPTGRALRVFGIDRLPLLWNVIRGDMAFWGPSLRTRSEAERLYRAAAWTYKLYAVRPGFAGAAGPTPGYLDSTAAAVEIARVELRRLMFG